jgi:hypothetical protein
MKSDKLGDEAIPSTQEVALILQKDDFQDEPNERQYLNRRPIILAKMLLMGVMLSLFFYWKKYSPYMRGINPGEFCIRDVLHNFFLNSNRVVESVPGINKSLLITSSLMIDCTFLHGAFFW